MARDFYAMLGVAKTADADTIKKAYKKLALKFHPDKNPGDKTAEQKFKDIAEACDILTDDKKRQVYDAYGEEGLKAGMGEAGAGAPGGFPGGDGRTHFTFTNSGGAGVDPRMFFQSMFGGDDPFGNIFGSMDSGMGGFGAGGRSARATRTRPQKRNPPDFEQPVRCTLEELYHGCVKKYAVERVTNPQTQAKEKKQFEITVKPGWKEGTKIRYEQDGGYVDGYVNPCDIVFVIKEKPHEQYKRSGDDLRLQAAVSLGDALLGTTLHVKDLAGRDVSVAIPGVIQPGKAFRSAGNGMVNSKTGRRGDLIVEMAVRFPQKLTAAQEKLVREARL